MSKAQREKGKRGEREVAEIAKRFGFDAHRSQQFTGKGESAADVVGIPYLHAEVKFHERVEIKKWKAQAAHDSDADHIPCVIWRGSREEWSADLPLESLLDLIRLALIGEDTLNKQMKELMKDVSEPSK